MRDWILLAVQVVLTGFVTYVAIAIWSVAGAGYDGGLQVVGYAVLSAPLTIAVLLLGLPLRLVPPVRRWWLRHAGWFVVLLGLAAGGMLLSYVVGEAGPVHYPETAESLSVAGYAPDPRLFWPSLVALAFAAMHLRLPLRRDAERPLASMRQ